jgi:hypothetical protein
MLAALVVFLLALGRFYPGSGADVLDWHPTRSPEVEAQNEIDDIAQMLEAQNERRRRRGLPDRTEEEIRSRVADDQRALRERSEAYLGDAEIDQVLARKNERRRRKGQPELTADEYRASLQGKGPGRPT